MKVEKNATQLEEGGPESTESSAPRAADNKAVSATATSTTKAATHAGEHKVTAESAAGAEADPSHRPLLATTLSETPPEESARTPEAQGDAQGAGVITSAAGGPVASGNRYGRTALTSLCTKIGQFSIFESVERASPAVQRILYTFIFLLSSFFLL